MYEEIEVLGEKMYMEEMEMKGVLKETIKEWKGEQRLLNIEEYTWIVAEWKKVLLEEMSRIEKQEIERKKEIQTQKMQQGIRYAPWAGKIWRACKAYQRADVGIPALRGDKGEILIGEDKDKHMANHIRNQWGGEERLLTPVPEGIGLKKAAGRLVEPILNSEIRLEEVKRVLDKAKVKKGPGPDLIPYEIWKMGGVEMQEYLRETFEEMRRTHWFPEEWKDSDIKWVFKKGSQLEIKNYRPIALSNTISKLFVKIMTDRIMKLAEATHIIADEQQGFRPDRTCTAAILILKTLMARASKKEEPFYLTTLDISKAYDNVNHNKLWEICEKMGLTGAWLECMKELYKDCRIRGIGGNGMTEWIKVKKGIKQGCPMSPILWAIYTSMVPEMLKKGGYERIDEPSMLMYADDMVIWGRSEEEIKNKLKIVCEAFDNLGLRLSESKTELQHNQWVIPSKEGETIRVEHNEKTEEVKYLPINKAIRYLGAWTTTDGNTDWGLELLKIKMEERLKRINKLNLHATQKATLVKGKILSAWNYTAGIQDINGKELEILESRLCQAVASKDLGRTVRRDMLFEKE